MQLESLANELLLELFEYFDTLHLLRAFSRLNSRLDTLLYKHFRAYHLDLRRIRKQDFNILCQQQLPLIVKRVVSLHLAGHNEPPGLLQLFLSRGFILDQFLHLQSLSLYRVRYTDVIKLLGESHRLVHLYRLNISQCDMSIILRDTSYSINQIWNLPKLTHLNLERCYLRDIQFSRLTVVSTTLQYLAIRTVTGCPFGDLVNIFQCTPHLRFLSICIDLQDEEKQYPIVVTSIITLQLQIYIGTRTLNSFLQIMPNLRHLRVEMFDNYLNGHKWKQIIVNHLPNLKVLRFKMLVHGLNNHNIDEQVDEILETFRTLFWLEEHRWYVRCDWNWDSDRRSSFGNLYTVPYAFDKFYDTAYKRSKWTCSDNKKYRSFDRVHSLIIHPSSNQSFDIHSGCFSNIYDLKIPIPLPHKIWSIIPTFDHLTSLSVSIYEKNILFDLQILLDRTPRLYTLMIEHENTSALRLVSKLTSASIRQLVFLPSISLDTLFFDDVDCAIFAQSSLAHQCEVLEIYVRSQTGVVHLVHAMVNLRVMIIYVCNDENADLSQVKYTRSSFLKGKLNSMRRELSLLWKRLSTRKRKSHTTQKDFPKEKSTASLDQMEHELIEWLQNTLQTTCWISCSSGWTDYFYSKYWIG